MRRRAIDPCMVDPTGRMGGLSFPSPPVSDHELAELAVFPLERTPLVRDEEVTLS